jgi:hypothetical protein
MFDFGVGDGFAAYVAFAVPGECFHEEPRAAENGDERGWGVCVSCGGGGVNRGPGRTLL